MQNSSGLSSGLTPATHASNLLQVQRRRHDVLKRIGNHPINRIDELLPWSIDLSNQPGDAI
jgi:hypothetical protein